MTYSNYDMSSNKYNSTWRNHPKSEYTNAYTMYHQQPKSSSFVQNITIDANYDHSLEDLIKQMAVNNLKLQ